MASSPVEPDAHRRFFDEYYAGFAEDPQAVEWRGRLARANFARIERLLDRGDGFPVDGRIIEVGFGDGSLLAEMGVRAGSGELVGYEVSRSAVEFASARPLPGAVRLRTFDGSSVPEPDGSFDLAVLSHVIEHSLNPGELIAEALRLAPRVALQVMLGETMVARWRGSRAAAITQLGRVHRFDRRGVRAAIASAGGQVIEEAVAVPEAWQRLYWRRSAATYAKAFASAGLGRISPALAGVAFTIDYSCIMSRRAPRR